MPKAHDSRTIPEVQETSVWTPPGGALGRLTSKALERAALTTPTVLADFRARAAALPPAMSFAGALRNAGGVAVIAEVKRRSPSKGALNPLISAPARAAEYVAGGAAVLSILTEPSEFGGNISDLIDVHRQVHVPLLRKDFHVHESQVWEARVAGASALLLIARALEPSRLEALVGEAMEAGLEPLIEVRSTAELDLALRLGASLIGINARDLETLAIEPDVVEQLLPRVPADRLAIAESGLGGVADVERLAARGADAVLVGSHLSLSEDGAAAVRALVGVPRQGRAA